MHNLQSTNKSSPLLLSKINPPKLSLAKGLPNIKHPEVKLPWRRWWSRNTLDSDEWAGFSRVLEFIRVAAVFGLLAPVEGGDVDYCDGLARVGWQGSGGSVEGLVVDGE